MCIICPGAASYRDTRCPPPIELCKIRREKLGFITGRQSFILFDVSLVELTAKGTCTLGLCTNRDDLGPFVTHNDDSHQLYSSFTEKNKKIPTSKQNQVRHQSDSFTGGGEMFHFGSGRRYRTFKATVDVMGSI